MRRKSRIPFVIIIIVFYCLAAFTTFFYGLYLMCVPHTLHYVTPDGVEHTDRCTEHCNGTIKCNGVFIMPYRMWRE